MSIEVITLITGIILILILAEVAVRNSIRLAQHFNWSGTFIGLTILSIGTSIPEIMAAVVGGIDILRDPSLTQTISGLIIGTNVGSDIFQQSFVLALVGLVGTIVVIKKNLLSEVGALIAGAILMWIMTIGGYINRFEGLIMLLAYAGYLIYLERKQRKRKHKDLTAKEITHKKVKKEKLSRKRIIFEIGTIIVAFAIMAFAAQQVIDSSTALVSLLPISASFFGVILLGIASALPELTTALIAILKHRKGISAGVLIGSNVTNPLMGIGLGALISGFAVPKVTIFYDLPCKIGIASIIFLFLWRNEKLNKWEAVALIGMFIAYLFFRHMFFPVDF
jgi:cation:H+ antiporter